jgi:hypothetical protein
MRRLSGVLLLLVLSAPLLCQNNSSEESAYQTAASKPQPADRLKALEDFLASHPQSALKLDALELLVWNSRSSGSVADLEHWSSQLLSVSPENPLAAAVIIDSSLPIGTPEPPADRAKRAIGVLEHFDRPEGFSHGDFAAMKNFVIATLNGVVGYSYFEQKEFAAARPYLRKAVDLLPNNAQFAYTLALSDLQGSNPDQAEGFIYLARSVNLTKGTAAGASLAQYARQKYREANGTDTDWDKYLANAVVPSAPPAAQPAPAVVASAPAATGTPASTRTHPNSVTPASTPSASRTTATASPSPAATVSTTAPTQPRPAPTSGTAVASTTTPAEPKTSTSAAPVPATGNSTRAGEASSGSIGTPAGAPVPKPNPPTSGAAAANTSVAVATPPPPPADEPPFRVMPPRHIPELTKGAPISLGLLIQSALAQRQTRQPIVFNLTDMFRRLHQNDEAFVMSFSKGLVFQEDLTSNDKALESAMDAIAPEPGAAIYDAVTFAAGHLNRISRNKNRVLVVISGEGDRNSGVSPLELSSELNVSGVRIYCIGLAVYSQNDQARLQQLAGYTGGRAFFISGADQIRSALQSISSDLGIAY